MILPEKRWWRWWFGVEPNGRVWEMSVCVCLSEEKRKKVKGRKGMAGQKREKRWCENEWWVGGGHV